MKLKNVTLGLALLLTTVSGVTFASQIGGERVIEKTREAVEEASPDDWFVLASSAKKCFQRKVNLKEAAEWLDKSLAISENSFNLELKGDYYIMNQLPNEAIVHYVKAIEKLEDTPSKNAQVAAIQKKIANVIGI